MLWAGRELGQTSCPGMETRTRVPSPAVPRHRDARHHRRPAHPGRLPLTALMPRATAALSTPTTALPRSPPAHHPPDASRVSPRRAPRLCARPSRRPPWLRMQQPKTACRRPSAGPRHLRMLASPGAGPTERARCPTRRVCRPPDHTVSAATAA
jgi:hypothetical protein